MKVGRNDPCPCGSGKKYKKCCLEKDELEDSRELAETYKPPRRQEIKDEWEPEDEPVSKIWDEDLEDPEEENFDEDLDEDTDDEIPQTDDESQDDDILKGEANLDDGDELPELSEEDNKLVDDWWEEYKMMGDTVTEREHLLTFMEQHPHLVDNLELQHEVLFELGADHFSEGIYETFVELLLRIRKEYPNTYRESFDWYDRDMIFWHTAQGRLDEIDPFFDLFRELGDSYGRLDETISFLRATNHSDILLKTLRDSTCSEYIRQVIVNDTISRCLDNPVYQESISSLMDELLLNGIKLNPQEDAENWREKLQRYLRPFTQWDANLPKKRSEAMKHYLNMTDNFAYFLYQKTGLSFDSAEYYSDTIYQYYLNVVSTKKYPENTFCLDKETVAKYSFLKSYRWIESESDYLAQINAFYHYATYLKTCGNITEEKRLEFQKQMKEIYQNYYSRVKNEGPEMLSFNQFPLWEIEE